MALDMNHEKSLKALYKRYPGVPDADSRQTRRVAEREE